MQSGRTPTTTVLCHPMSVPGCRWPAWRPGLVMAVARPRARASRRRRRRRHRRGPPRQKGELDARGAT
eukprot:366408-Chlamydomonas_euryale.AAC.3